ncbi:MAG: sugar ABC transporter permease [Rhodospirillales bacterium]|nr:sugar ABC transporter permease [Acetobacter sp.]
MKRNWIAYLFLTPALLFGFVFFILPVLLALALTFTNFQAFTPVKWIGLANYQYLLRSDPFFLETLKNTAIFVVGALLAGIPLALLVAYASSRSRGRGFWRSVFWLPTVTNVIAIAFVWRFVLANATGLLNRALDFFHLPGPGWLTSPWLAIGSIIAVFIWMNLGKGMLLLSAGIDGIDESYFEAAKLDGANGWHLFTRVAIPLLKPTLLFVLITDFIACFSSFPLIMVLTEGGPAHSTTVTALYTYDMAFADLRLGRASAAAFILFLLIFFAMWAQLRLFRRAGMEIE